MLFTKTPSLLFSLILGALPVSQALAQPTIRAEKTYEDTVRVLILSNDSAKGYCGDRTNNVGIRTRDFVLKSLTGVPNVIARETQSTTWENVKQLWPGKLPHVIVHVNAGWSSLSGNYINEILNTAADSAIGVVSIGDDAASFAEKTFGFKNVDNQPQPMGDAQQFRDATTRLWLDLDGRADTVGGGGIIRNTTDSLKVSRLFFNPLEPGSGADPAARYRCQADADKYTVDPAYADKVTFMGFQRAFNGTDTVAGPRDLQAIVSFQDDVRRGVALSYQPQFLADEKSAHQIDYDAVMYASFAHFLREPALHFTDETGRALAPGAAWSPAKGKLYLSFTDDFVRADLAKEIRLSAANGGGGLPDAEILPAPGPAKTTGGKGIWRVEIDLADLPGATASNRIMEVTLPSVITATVFSHDENGLPDGGTATAQLTLRVTETVDTITAAYMKDADGDGAGDRAYFLFTRPLAALPATIGPVYWNAISPANERKKPARIDFLAGSGQRIVVADFTGMQFPQGLTSVPAGAAPHAVFPAEGVFGGQKPALADSMGPVPLRAAIALGAQGPAGRLPDTLTVILSEPTRAGAASPIRFAKFAGGLCPDRAGSAPAMPMPPAAATLDGLGYTLILDAASPNPVSGDCAYLEGDGSLRDLPGNAPTALGVRITGPKIVEGLRTVGAYPPVAGGSALENPGFPANATWIPPVGFRPGETYLEPILPVPGQPATGQDPGSPQPLPPDAGLVKVMSTGKYLARVTVFDNLGVFVTRFGQSFGYRGELDNPLRAGPQGYQSYLVWNLRDAEGRRAGQGVYLWKVEFTLDNGERVSKTFRTGLLREY